MIKNRDSYVGTFNLVRFTDVISTRVHGLPEEVFEKFKNSNIFKDYQIEVLSIEKVPLKGGEFSTLVELLNKYKNFPTEFDYIKQNWTLNGFNIEQRLNATNQMISDSEYFEATSSKLNGKDKLETLLKNNGKFLY